MFVLRDALPSPAGVLLREMWHGKRAWLGVQPVSIMGQVAAGALFNL